MGKSSFKPFCHTFASDSNHEPRRRRPPIRNPLIPQMRMEITNKDLLTRIETLERLVFLAKEVLSLEEASIYLDISRSTLYKMTSAKQIPHYKPNGKIIYFKKSELNSWMRQNPVKSLAQIEEDAATYLAKLDKAKIENKR